MSKTMSERLRKLREQNGLSQTKVAEILNVSTSLISAYEKRECTPALDKLIMLADLYHTSTDYILGRTASESSILLDVSHLSSSQIQILNSLIKDMGGRTAG